jgi:hypothetical protein
MPNFMNIYYKSMTCIGFNVSNVHLWDAYQLAGLRKFEFGILSGN